MDNAILEDFKEDDISYVFSQKTRESQNSNKKFAGKVDYELEQLANSKKNFLEKK